MARPSLMTRAAFKPASMACIRRFRKSARWGSRMGGCSMSRLFDESDEETHGRVCVIGFDIRHKLFSGLPAVGETIKLNGLPFTVVGSLKNKVQDAGDQSDNNQVLVP